MLAMLLLLPSFASASDVATREQFGIGVATGYPFLNVTGKYYLGPKAGIAAYVGTAFYYQNLRGAYQLELTELHAWDWARLNLYGQAGLDIGLVTQSWGKAQGRIGPFVGAGTALQFNKVPLEVFAELGIGVEVVNTYCHAANAVSDGACWIGINGGSGARWYF